MMPTTDQFTPSTYRGIRVTGELCKNNQGIDLCGGLRMFRSVESSKAIAGGIPGGGEITNDLLSYGLFVKIPMSFQRIVFSPYAGLDRIHSDVASSNPLVNVDDSADDKHTAAFIGSEIGFMLTDHAHIGVAGEAGTSLSGEDFDYYSGRGFVRLTF